MKINTKVLLILLLISLSHIESTHSSFRASFGLMKKSNNRNLKSNTQMSTNTNAKTNHSSKGVITKFFAVSTSITKSKTVTTKSGSTTSSTSRGGDIPDYNVYYDGWVKYLRYTDQKVKKPKAFYKNTRYAPESRSKLSIPEFDNVNY